MANQNSLSEQFNIMADDAVHRLHQNYQSKIDKRIKSILKKSGLKATNELRSFVKDAVHLSFRLRVKDEMPEDELISAMKDIVLEQQEKAHEFLETVKSRVHNRERDKSSYSAADLSDEDKSWIERAHNKRKDKDRVEELFKGKDRIYLRLPEEISDTRKAAERLLKKQPEKYEIVDWAAGKATDATGKQLYKIGKLLAKLDNKLYDSFVNDGTRNAGKLIVVISRDYDDIARASTNRGWASCAGAGSGRTFAFGKMDKHVKEGGMIAYLTSENDPDIHDPLARVMIKPYDLDEEKFSLTRIFSRLVGSSRADRDLFALDRVYGLSDELFKDTVRKVVDSHLNANAVDGRYVLRDGLYWDSLHSVQMRNNKLRY